MRIGRSTHTEVVVGPGSDKHAYRLEEIDIRYVMIDVVGTEACPIRLLSVVIHMVVAVPGRAPCPIDPVAEEARRGPPRAYTAVKEVKTAVPGPLKWRVLHRDCRR